MTFEEFAAGQLPGVLGFAAVLTGDRASAEDIVQETLIRAYRRWDKIGSMDRPESYIRKMIVNEFLSSRRRLRRLVLSGRGSELDDRQTPDHASRWAEHDALLAKLRKLPRRQRAVIVLRYYEDLSYAEIAEILGCAPVTVRGYVSRALGTLRVEMAGDPAGEAAEHASTQPVQGPGQEDQGPGQGPRQGPGQGPSQGPGQGPSQEAWHASEGRQADAHRG